MRRGPLGTRGKRSLLAEAELLDHCPVALDFRRLQIVEKPSPLSHHPEQPAATVMVALVDLEMLRQVLDPFGEKRDLDLGRTGVRLVGLELPDHFALPLRR